MAHRQFDGSSPQYSDAPEVVPQEHSPTYSAPEVVPSPESHKLHPPTDGASNEKIVAPDNFLPEVVEAGGHGPKHGRWWQRKRIWVILLIALLIVIGLVVGLVVGLGAKNKSDDSSDSSDSTSDSDSSDSSDGSDNSNSTNTNTKSFCDGLCPQVLSSTTSEDTLYIFARTAKNHIAYITNNGSSWDDWIDLGEPKGDLISQPAAIAWQSKTYEIPRVDVFAVSSSENTVYGRRLENDSWSAWDDLGPNAGSQPILCKVYDDRIDIWSTDSSDYNITHNWWLSQLDDPTWYTEGGTWQPQDFGTAASAPGVVCRDTDIIHDVVWYDRDDSMVWHEQWNEADQKWLDPQSFDGTFIGDPTVVSFSDDSERLDFFGIQENNEMYHFSWSSSDGHSSLKSLGGNITSVPSVVSLSKGTYDVLALGNKGTLQHASYDGSDWSDWDDTGIEAQSAPLAINVDDQVLVFVLGEDSQLVCTTMDVSVKMKWTKSSATKTSLGGDLSREFYVQEDA
ncbi:hypothetical protein AK830_g4863 [Neonectria ditissima]|uniref:PLL-like beta propeller domain-containing protein n=1 Tax=Neonectria ditissima TaxID=78410 RepID=A0A0P7B5L7_9HYPO|nr:hypothetical protein AK830_g4863 [Neonectria ditissima]